MSLFFFLIAILILISVHLLPVRILVEDGKQPEHPRDLGIIEFLELISDILHFNLVFSLASYENNKWAIPVVVVRSVVTSSSIIFVILVRRSILDHSEIIFLSLILGIECKELIEDIGQVFLGNWFIVILLILSFRVESYEVDKFIIYLIFDVFPSEWKFSYLRIYNLDYVRLWDIKRFNDPFGPNLELLEEVFNPEQGLVRIFASVYNCLWWHLHFFQFLLNIALKWTRDVSNSLLLSLRPEDLYLKFFSVLFVCHVPKTFSLELLHLNFNLISDFTPLKDNRSELVDDVLNIVFSYLILLVLIRYQKFLLDRHAFSHLVLNKFIARCV